MSNFLAPALGNRQMCSEVAFVLLEFPEGPAMGSAASEEGLNTAETATTTAEGGLVAIHEPTAELKNVLKDPYTLLSNGCKWFDVCGEIIFNPPVILAIRKHPFILNPKHLLTRIIMMHLHIKTYHCGAQALLAIIRDEFWPVAGKS
ncbi:hypothetical protein ILUMI_14590 [Ignelater luminosus]|uniref:Integrase zinc-binding domain-containing protein n=1 Tax=Ignelater luminosus TaxID=2038154 RepID=A0A8K0GAS6_IGNLU|nr:hypothetical protein ILUMI_14590 [Ignelater luminosus]